MVVSEYEESVVNTVGFPTQSGVWLKLAVGSQCTSTCFMMVSLHPLSSVTIKVTEYIHNH